MEFRAFIQPRQGAGYADQVAVAQTDLRNIPLPGASRRRIAYIS